MSSHVGSQFRSGLASQSKTDAIKGKFMTRKAARACISSMMLLVFVCFSAIGNGQWVRAAASLPQANVRAMVTSSGHKLSSMPPVPFKDGTGVAGQTIVVDPEKKFQSMLGF